MNKIDGCTYFTIVRRKGLFQAFLVTDTCYIVGSCLYHFGLFAEWELLVEHPNALYIRTEASA